MRMSPKTVRLGGCHIGFLFSYRERSTEAAAAGRWINPFRDAEFAKWQQVLGEIDLAQRQVPLDGIGTCGGEAAAGRYSLFG